MGRGLGPLQLAIIDVLAQQEKPGMAHFPFTTSDVVERVDPSWYGNDTRVRAVRRALDSLWTRGLVDKLIVTWSGDLEHRAGVLSWRIHDDDRPAEPTEQDLDAYGRPLL